MKPWFKCCNWTNKVTNEMFLITTHQWIGDGNVFNHICMSMHRALALPARMVFGYWENMGCFWFNVVVWWQNLACNLPTDFCEGDFLVGLRTSCYHPHMQVGNVFSHVCLCVCLSMCLSVCVYTCSGYNLWTPSHRNFIFGIQMHLYNI